MDVAARILILRAQWTARRAARQRRARLERELAAYSTEAARLDLEATLEHYPDGVTWELREILARQAMTGHRQRRPAGLG